MNLELENFRPSPEPLGGAELLQAIKAAEAKKAARRRFLLAAELHTLKALVVVFRVLHSII